MRRPSPMKDHVACQHLNEMRTERIETMKLCNELASNPILTKRKKDLYKKKIRRLNTEIKALDIAAANLTR